jgi:lysozyme family protein
MTADDATFLYVDIAVLLGVLGLLMILAGWAAAKGRLKRNYVIGMRTSAIMRSDETWRVAHKKCAWSFWSSGGVLVAGALLLNVLRPPGRWATALLMVMTALVGVIVLVGAVQAARTVEHEAPGQDRT